MQIFKLKKGGETENVEETIVVLNRNIDRELLISSINKQAEKGKNEAEILKYIEDNFKAVYFVEKDIETFYYWHYVFIVINL